MGVTRRESRRYLDSQTLSDEVAYLNGPEQANHREDSGDVDDEPIIMGRIRSNFLTFLIVFEALVRLVRIMTRRLLAARMEDCS